MEIVSGKRTRVICLQSGDRFLSSAENEIQGRLDRCENIFSILCRYEGLADDAHLLQVREEVQRVGCDGILLQTYMLWDSNCYGNLFLGCSTSRTLLLFMANDWNVFMPWWLRYVCKSRLTSRSVFSHYFFRPWTTSMRLWETKCSRRPSCGNLEKMSGSEWVKRRDKRN